MISVFAAGPPTDGVKKRLAGSGFLISGVADGDPKRSGIAAGFQASPAKALSRGNLSLGGHCEIILGN